MARFTTRVVLHKEGDNQSQLDWAEYDTLHDEMEIEGFSRTILGKNGIEYYLPPAEYNKIGDFTAEQVREAAITAVKKTGKRYSILVTEGYRFWAGLQKVKK